MPAIEKHGGEVLKLIGDGMLAIFPSGSEAAALDASQEAIAALGGKHRIGIALRVGDIEYGNIGSPSRLDFTAIGPAVNLAARLEGVASKTGRAIVSGPAVLRERLQSTALDPPRLRASVVDPSPVTPW